MASSHARQIAAMTHIPRSTVTHDLSEHRCLAEELTGRYGPLALTRAAGEHAAAKRRGDQAQKERWNDVVVDLWQSMVSEQL